MAEKIFDSIRVKAPQHSVFDLSHDHKLSMKMGYLVPCLCQETLPGDHFHMSSEAMFRLMPLVSPMMHKVDVFMHFWFVPNRILWPNFEQFMSPMDDGTPLPLPPAWPILDRNQSYVIDPSSLPNYLGLPVGSIAGTPDGQDISAMPFAAYQRIFFEYYRDQNLDPGSPIVLSDGEQTSVDSNNLMQLRHRAWEHDYFTSALPFAQKGAAVTMPLDLTGNVNVKSHAATGGAIGGSTPFVRDAAGALLPPQAAGIDAGGHFAGGSSGVQAFYDPDTDLYLDQNDFVTQTTINDLRTAFSLQRWLELSARAGSRFTETLRAFFNVRSSDARLQRPEYIGGSVSSMAISEVLQTSQTDTTAQGTMAGHGISVNGGRDFSYKCEEWGFIIGIVSVRPKTAYFQGIPKFFSKTIDRFQYPWPQFVNLGEQEILVKEVYYDDSAAVADMEATFGYIPRYAEYRFNNGRISGELATSLDFWHMGRSFSSIPALNAHFVYADPITRVFAVDDPDIDQIVAHIYFKIAARRPLPKYGTPGGL